MTRAQSDELIDEPGVREGEGRRRSVSHRGRVFASILRSPIAALSLIYLVVLVGSAIFAPWLAPHDPTATNLQSVLTGPTATNPLGTDVLGRDVLTRLMYGGRVSLVNASVAVLTVFVIATTGGIAAGFFAGAVDRVFSWVMDLIIAMPALVVLLVILGVFGNNMMIAMIALGILMSPSLGRIVRGATLAERRQLYVAAARVSGLPSWYILLRHVVPRVTGPIVVSLSLLAGAALLVDSGLAYLGFGVQPPTPTWGGMIADAGSVMGRQPWLLIPSGLTLGLATLAFGLLGDTARDAMAETGRTRRSAPRGRTNLTHSVRPPEPSDALLSVSGISVSLPIDGVDTTVVEDASLFVSEGETVGLVGESGCGKSITARSILGLLPDGGNVTSGSIRFADRELVGLTQKELRRLRGSQIAMVSQEPMSALDPVFTAGQQLGELIKRHHGGSRSEVRSRALSLLEDVRLDQPDRVARAYPHELSGGMAQRVAIAMALAGEPRLLIADEPTTALDVTIQSEILDLLAELQRKRGMAILLITHNWGVVAEMCDRAYVMYAGHVVESAAAAALLRHPRHPYTLGLLGSTPRRATPREPLKAIPGTVPHPGQWPAGCHFAPRCGFATTECVEHGIPLFEAGQSHVSRCIHHDLVRGGGE